MKRMLLMRGKGRGGGPTLPTGCSQREKKWGGGYLESIYRVTLSETERLRVSCWVAAAAAASRAASSRLQHSSCRAFRHHFRYFPGREEGRGVLRESRPEKRGSLLWGFYSELGWGPTGSDGSTRGRR